MFVFAFVFVCVRALLVCECAVCVCVLVCVCVWFSCRLQALLRLSLVYRLLRRISEALALWFEFDITTFKYLNTGGHQSWR